jgi:hypothetical protein
MFSRRIPAASIPVPVEDVSRGADYLDAVQHGWWERLGFMQCMIWIAL